MLRLIRSIGLPVASLLLACGEDADADADAESTGEASTDAETGDGDGDGDGEAVDVFARGIRADDIEINQGVAVPVVIDGHWVGPTERTSSVYSNRTTLIHVPWVMEDGFEPREIEARLILDTPTHEEPLVVVQRKFIDEESYPGSIDRNFSWVVPPEEIVADVKFRVELYETDPKYAELAEPDPPPVAPADGSQLLGVEDFAMELKVVLVPVDYSSGNCDTLALPTEDQAKQFVQYLFERNAVQSVAFRIHETPIVRDAELTTLAAFFEPLQQYRVMDDAAPNEYYFALVNACSGGVGGAGGIAAGTPPPTKMAAAGRVCVGLWLPNTPNFGYETFVHEIGHTQGRPHTFCPGGGADGPDPNFPDPDGKIGVWGFGIQTFVFRNPASQFDYMSYCNPTWVSDWNWVKTGAQIKTLTAWDYEDQEPDPEVTGYEGEVLVGLLHGDGSEQWWTTKGGVENSAFSAEHRFVYDTPEGELEVGASFEVLEDGTGYVMAPMPVAVRDLRSVTGYVGAAARTIDTAKISVQPRSWEEWHARP